MDMRKPQRTVLALLVVAGAFFAWRLATSERALPLGVDVDFLGYTNDARGTRFGLFSISNRGKASIERLSPAVKVDGNLSLRAPVFNPGLPWLSRAPLRSRGSQTLAVGVPQDAEAWSLVVRYQRMTIPERLRDSWMSHGHSVPVRLGPLTLLGPPQYLTAVSRRLDETNTPAEKPMGTPANQ